MSLEPLPCDLEQSVQRFAEQQNVSHDQAIIMLIETGLKHSPVENMSEASTSSTPNVWDWFEGKIGGVRTAAATRHCHLKKGPQPPILTADPEGIIGLFADSPDTVDNILREVETRSDRYANGQ